MTDLGLLAQVEDVEALAGKKFEGDDLERLQAVLGKLSADFRHEARRDFAICTYTHRRKVDGGGKVWLPQAPVQEVKSVVDDNGNKVAFHVLLGGIVVQAPSHSFVTVTYKAGFEQVPHVIRMRIADAAKRALAVQDIKQANMGVDSLTRQTGPFSQTVHVASWAVGGQAMLTPEALDLARSYRRTKRGHTWLSA